MHSDKTGSGISSDPQIDFFHFSTIHDGLWFALCNFAAEVDDDREFFGSDAGPEPVTWGVDFPSADVELLDVGGDQC